MFYLVYNGYNIFLILISSSVANESIILQKTLRLTVDIISPLNHNYLVKEIVLGTKFSIFLLTPLIRFATRRGINI